jgi:formate hydrogenlyase transcriptional activator
VVLVLLDFCEGSAMGRVSKGESLSPTVLWDHREGFTTPASTSTVEDSIAEAALKLTSRVDVDHVCDAVLIGVERVFAPRMSWIALHDKAANMLHVRLCRGHGAEVLRDAKVPPGEGLTGQAFSQKRAIFVPDASEEHPWYDPAYEDTTPFSSMLLVPLVFGRQALGVLGLDAPAFTVKEPPAPADLQRLRIFASHAAIGINTARLYEARQQDRRRLHDSADVDSASGATVTPSMEGIESADHVGNIVGQSAALKEVARAVEQVADADLTVLVLGETGTGKELVARALHERSSRTARPFVPVNCAALPETLVESELFGHERGAFTGAVGRKSGRFEQAHRGTIFLDEVGDLPADAQAKLLRVLQDGIVQRVGGAEGTNVDARIIAATNQDLAASVAAGRFRADLYYRLSVFPILLPPLRDRLEDIPLLTRHFVAECGRRLGRRITRIEERVWERLRSHDWPGNVRELQNVIERAIILASDGVLRGEVIRLDPVAQLATPSPALASAATSAQSREGGDPGPQTFSDAERRAIIDALRRARGRVSGPAGAASLLGLRPTTLHGKMKKLRISREDAWNG